MICYPAMSVRKQWFYNPARGTSAAISGVNNSIILLISLALSTIFQYSYLSNQLAGRVEIISDYNFKFIIVYINFSVAHSPLGGAGLMSIFVITKRQKHISINIALWQKRFGSFPTIRSRFPKKYSVVCRIPSEFLKMDFDCFAKYLLEVEYQKLYCKNHYGSKSQQLFRYKKSKQKRTRDAIQKLGQMIMLRARAINAFNRLYPI